MQQLDILTNLHPRTFPKGLSVEIGKLENIQPRFNENIGKHAREHVTSMFYDAPTKFGVEFGINNSKSFRLVHTL